MASMEHLQTYKVICEGGLNSDRNYILLSDRRPGCATALINFEPSLYGGYRRINGYGPLVEDFSEVDPTNAEGKILGVAIFGSDILSARKQKSGDTYTFYKEVPNSAWSAYTTGLTLSSTSLNRIRYDKFNFNGTDKIVFTDGVNDATLFDGTNWINVSSTASGADYANAGGAMALTSPKYVALFKNHIFVAGDPNYPHVLAHSAPQAEYDWTAASGSGQIIAGFKIKQIKPFRDELYVFGETKIKKVVISGTDFTLQDVTDNVGCLAPDSVLEVNGDLQFLSQDGFRTIAGTERIGDVELAVQSKDIQQDVTDLIRTSSLEGVCSVVIRRKSQVRHFFSNSLLSADKSLGIIGGLRDAGQGLYWEWGRLRGLSASCVTSGYIAAEEYVIHGGFDGCVYRQEQGSTFNGTVINSVYQTPYFDFGEVQVRKTLHKITVFIKAEGNIQLGTAIQYDYDSRDVLNPASYTLESDLEGVVYGEGVYGQDVYAGKISPMILTNIEGSGFSNRITFSDSTDNQPYSIQAILYEFIPNGRK